VSSAPPARASSGSGHRN